jgi:CelD/BcsL family acetyltransferase involved in cellulose biosynthesis
MHQTGRLGLRIEIVESLEALELYRDDWDRLLLKSGRGNPALSYAWIASFFEHCMRPGQSWLCVLAFSDREMVGVLPIVSSLHPLFGEGAISLSTPTDLQTQGADLLALPGMELEVMVAMLDALESRVSRWFSLSFTRIPEESATCRLVSESVRGYRIMSDLNGWGSYVSLMGSIEDHLETFGGNFKRNLKKAQNRLDRLPGTRLEFLKHSGDNSDIAEHFFHLESQGWKGKEGTSIGQSPKLLRFYGSMLKRLSQSGWLEWHALWRETDLMAGHMAIRLNDVLTIPKISYSEEYSRVSPGNLLFLSMLEREFDDSSSTEIDCLTDMAWHKSWAMKKRKYFDIVIWPDHLLNRWCGLYPRMLKDRIRGIESIRQLVRLARKLGRG